MSAASEAARPAAPGPVSRRLSGVIGTLVGVLLGYVLLGTTMDLLTGGDGTRGGGADWVGSVERVLYGLLAVLTVGKVLVDRQWRRFRTGADLGLLVLTLCMVLAGLVNDSTAALLGQALYGYLHAVVIFYALRAADPGPTLVRRVLLGLGGLLAVNVVVALAQLVLGEPAYRAVGWADSGWAAQGRAQGLLGDPDQLGQVLGLALLGLLAYAAVSDTLRRGWWPAATVVAVALAATGSAGALAGVVVAALLILLLVRAGARRVLGVCLVLVCCTAALLVVRPEHRSGWQVTANSGLTVVDRAAPPAGPPPAAGSATAEEPDLGRTVGILSRQPLLGFGIGQFGGPVAERDNPQWRDNPKFGTNDFRQNAGRTTTVNSFWLQLAMETGFLGVVAFLLWLLMVVRPLVPRPAGGAPGAGAGGPSALVVWGVAAVALAVVTAFPSPSFAGPVLPALLWAVVGLAWWVRRQSEEARASVFTAETALLPKVRRAEPDTHILSTDEILALARRARRADRRE
ncbi:hypothetical protein AWW66_06700 [Micromonospora rosaria]|uniref:Uncharacterized protein n=1 Tax=Micromonospora rosaria TaxID=47874 RepID=A0A136PW66_9ACTN|nr:hypothetical protein [Micromonospora rosaria]KXK62728.1 hypothetical protein AWW66_06700 [Micromonospora rosaria]